MQGAMAPEWNGAARGVFYGLTLAHTRAHMTRAVLEGSAFGLRDILEAMRNAGLENAQAHHRGRRRQRPALRQIKADVTGLPVRVPTSVETTATGAAILAAVGAGVHATVADAVEAFVSYQPEEHEPDPGARDAYDDAYRRYRDVYFALKPTFAPAETGGRPRPQPRSKYLASSQSVTQLLSKMICSCTAVFSRCSNTKSPNPSRATALPRKASIASWSDDGTRGTSFAS